jgi:hypothetical protein
MAKAIAAGLGDAPPMHSIRLQIAYAENDSATQERELKWFAESPQRPQGLSIQANNALALGQPAHARAVYQGTPLPPALNAQIQMLMEYSPSPVGNSSEKGKRKGGGDGNRSNALQIYQNAEILLDQGKAAEAAMEFQKIVENKLAFWGVPYPLSMLGLARAAAAIGDTARSKHAYEDLFALWKNVEPGLAPLASAQRDYAALK